MFFCSLQETDDGSDDKVLDLSFTVISKTSVLLRQYWVLGSKAYDGIYADGQDRRDLGQEISRQTQNRARTAEDIPKTTQDESKWPQDGPGPWPPGPR